MSRWFRHYAGMMRDDKLVRVAIKSKQSIERVLWIWGAILESASEVDDGGRYDVDADEIAYFLRADSVDVDAVISSLEASGHLLNGIVVSWANRQFLSDKSADRQARYRERKRKQEDRVEDNAPVECGDVTVTLPSRHGDAPETETETEVLEAKASCESRDSQPGQSEENSEGKLLPEHVVEVYNEMAGRLGKPKVRTLTPERRTLLKARIAGYTLDEFREVLGNIERSPFLRGDTGWKGCGFDWIFKKANFQKILEGNYNE